MNPPPGLGNLIRACRETLPDCTIAAVEMAPQCAVELYREEWAGVTLWQRDFLKVTPEELGLFDAVAMNPPFHLRADIWHIFHARTFLKPGGVLAGICMDTPARTTALRSMCDTWERLPAGTFREAGTGVATVLFRMQKPLDGGGG